MLKSEAEEWIDEDPTPEGAVSGTLVKYKELAGMNVNSLYYGKVNNEHCPDGANCPACVCARILRHEVFESCIDAESSCEYCALPVGVCKWGSGKPLWSIICRALIQRDQHLFTTACMDIVMICQDWLDDEGVSYE